MSKIEAKRIVKRFAKRLTEKRFSFEAIYLFGSYAKGRPHKWSDIDVAVISNRFKENVQKNRFSLRHIRREIDTRLEPHGLAPDDFADEANPLAYEVKRTGIKIV